MKLKKILTILLCFSVLLSLFSMTLTASAEESVDWSETVIDESGVIDDGEIWIDEQRPALTDFVEDEADLYGKLSFDSENSEQLQGERVIDQILIKFKDPSLVPGKEKQLQHEIEKFEKVGFVEELDVYIVKISDLEKNPNSVLNRLKNNKYIEYVEPNYTMKADGLEPLSEAAYKRYMVGTSAMINSPAGWDMFAPTGGDSSVTIAVVDSGVVQHSLLPLLRNGYSAVSGLSPNNDKMAHGTSVAGVIGAIGAQGKGVAGINWDASIMPVKIDDNNGTMSVANVAKGIIWAADNGARVINLSLGTTSNSETLRNAVDYAYKKGCALFAATGNSGKSVIEYPAAFANVLAVGSTNDNATRTATSTYGAGMDVVASGGYYTTIASGVTAMVAGTSISTPQAAGLASLIWAINPNLSNDEVYDMIRQNAKTLGGGYNNETGYGLIDVGKTLEAAVASIGEVETKPEPKANPTITLAGFSEITYFEGTTFVEDGYRAFDCDGNDITDRVQVVDNIQKWTAGLYTVKYTVTDDYEGTTSVTRTVIVEAAPVPEPEIIDEPETPEVPVDPTTPDDPNTSEGPDIPAEPEPQSPPTITVNGSNIVILHIGGTPYREQGARAIDNDGVNISDQVVVSGSPNTSATGTYIVNYTITGKSGMTANASRTVRVLAPIETIERRPYGFNSQAKQGSVVTHTNIVADQFGWMDLRVNSIDKNMTIKVDFIDSLTKKTVFTDTFSAAGMKQYQIGQGRYDMKVTIDKANGNSKYDIGLMMPELIMVEFLEDEIPLAEAPDDAAEEVVGNTTYTVVSGDSLYRIAHKIYGDSLRWFDIYNANIDIIGSNPSILYPGQVLTIPN